MSDSAYALLDVYVPWKRLDYCSPEPIFRNEAVDPRNGNRIRSWNIFSLNKEIQADYQSKRFEITAPGGSVTNKEFTIQRRYTLPDQLEKLFADNGFAIEGVYGGYRREAPTAKSEQMMYVLRKA